MRSLIFLFVFLPIIAWAASPLQFKAELEGIYMKSPLARYDIEGQESALQKNINLAFTQDRIISSLGYGITLNATEADLAELDFVNSELALTWLKGTWSFESNYLFSLYSENKKPSLLTFQSQKSFYNKSTIVGAEITSGSFKQNNDSYINVDFKTKYRPTTVDQKSYSLNFEQLLSEKFKLKIDEQYFQANQERPSYLASSLTLAYAPVSRWYLKSFHSFVDESEKNTLKNERGYFSVQSHSFEMTYEYKLEHLLSLSYGVTLENESDPRNSSKTQYAQDTYVASLRFPISNYWLKSSLIHERSNTDFKSFSLSFALEATL